MSKYILLLVTIAATDNLLAMAHQHWQPYQVIDQQNGQPQYQQQSYQQPQPQYQPQPFAAAAYPYNQYQQGQNTPENQQLIWNTIWQMNQLKQQQAIAQRNRLLERIYQFKNDMFSPEYHRPKKELLIRWIDIQQDIATIHENKQEILNVLYPYENRQFVDNILTAKDEISALILMLEEYKKIKDSYVARKQAHPMGKESSDKIHELRRNVQNILAQISSIITRSPLDNNTKRWWQSYFIDRYQNILDDIQLVNEVQELPSRGQHPQQLAFAQSPLEADKKKEKISPLNQQIVQIKEDLLAAKSAGELNRLNITLTDIITQLKPSEVDLDLLAKLKSLLTKIPVKKDLLSYSDMLKTAIEDTLKRDEGDLALNSEYLNSFEETFNLLTPKIKKSLLEWGNLADIFKLNDRLNRITAKIAELKLRVH